MNDVENRGNITRRIEFTKNLNHVISRIQAANNVDEIMSGMSQDICTLFNADRLTIYRLGEDKVSLISRVKIGLDGFKDLKLPIAEQSIAGYAALNKKLLNINDVYDEQELKQHSPQLSFLRGVDRRTGYHTKQMLVAPILSSTNGELIGIIQLINNKDDMPFFIWIEEGVQDLSQAIALAFRRFKQNRFKE
ncbi:MAG: GAF domain-containing protein [Gallionella sp.]|nr:GAF domain-containing protein [Gallionella sp.]